MTKISAIIYSYKNKNLFNVVESTLNNTAFYLDLTVIDQNPIDRSEMFKKFPHIKYKHMMWDLQLGRGHIHKTFLDDADGEYVLLLSDDIYLQPKWDINLIPVINNKTIISGQSDVSLSQKDLFAFKKEYQLSSMVHCTQWIDSNFILFKRSLLDNVEFPTMFKYYGFEEYFTLELIKNKVDIYCAIAKTYTDTKIRNLENLYSPYSLEHNYNTMIEYLESNAEEAREFKKIHNINFSLHKLPYHTNDVEYVYYEQFDIDIMSDENKKYNTRINRIG